MKVWKNVVLEGINIQHICEAESIKQVVSYFNQSVVWVLGIVTLTLIPYIKKDLLCGLCVPLNLTWCQ